MTTYYLVWQTDDCYPNQGYVEVQADSPFNAVAAGDLEMTTRAAMNDGPQLWRWMGQPMTERPWPAWRDGDAT